MRISTAVACCLVIVLGVASLPRDSLVASLSYLRWLHVVAAVGIVVDARRLRLHLHPSGMGKGNWHFWAVFLVWPLVAIAWYFTLREWVLVGRTSHPSLTAHDIVSG
jgi:hypothetical protein